MYVGPNDDSGHQSNSLHRSETLCKRLLFSMKRLTRLNIVTYGNLVVPVHNFLPRAAPVGSSPSHASFWFPHRGLPQAALFTQFKLCRQRQFLNTKSNTFSLLGPGSDKHCSRVFWCARPHSLRHPHPTPTPPRLHPCHPASLSDVLRQEETDE